MNSFSDILRDEVRKTGSRLCIGLDVDATRLGLTPSSSLQDLKDFTRMVIDHTVQFCVAFKLNLAFFERYGSRGFEWLEETLSYIDGQRLTIADAKRGDISSSAVHYASAIFDHFGFDAITVNPYMGRDAISPFLVRPEKGVFVLCLTSNAGASDLQFHRDESGVLYEKVISLVKGMNARNNCGLVVGATKEVQLKRVRQEAGDMPLLVPGVGAQGGNLETSARAGNRGGIALISISRGILYAGDEDREAIGEAARNYCSRINACLG